MSTGAEHVEPRPLISGAALSAIGHGVITITGAGATIAVARILGPVGSGGYAVAQTLLLLLTVVTTLGIDHGIIYYVSSGVWSPRAAYGSALRMSALMGSGGALFGVAARLVVPAAFAGLSVWLTVVVACALPFTLAWLYGASIAVAVDSYEAYVLPPSVQSALALVLVLPGTLEFGLSGAVVGSAAASGAVGVGVAVWAKTRLKETQAPSAGRLRAAIAFGIKGYAANALQLLNYRIDLLVLAAVASTATVGQYSVAVAITSTLWLLPNALSEVLFPRVAYLTSRVAEEQRDLAEIKALRFASLLTIGGTAVIAASLEFLVMPVYGGAFRPTIDLGFILLPGAALLGISSVMASTIVGRGRPVYTLYGSLVTTPITLVLYASLIPWLHASGAALASTLSYTASFILLCWFYLRVTQRKLLPLLVPTRSEMNDLLEGLHFLRARVRGRRM